jgi:hypothetical protein
MRDYICSCARAIMLVLALRTSRNASLCYAEQAKKQTRLAMRIKKNEQNAEMLISNQKERLPP